MKLLPQLLLLVTAFAFAAPQSLLAQAAPSQAPDSPSETSNSSTDVLRVGIIGLDTSHAPAFARTMNSPDAPGDLQHCRVVAAYPHGSADIQSSVSRIPKYTKELQAMGVEITDSIDDLLQQVDCVLLETNDGRLHLQQALKVFRAGKPVFIDKPLGSNLAEVIAIFQAAEKSQTPVFSSSSLRYSSGVQSVRDGRLGDVLGCSAYSPCSLEPTHTDLFWYGIHGVEILYTCMGTGCQSVSHTSTDNFEFATGRWDDGRIGSFRGIREGKSGYGATVFGSKAIGEAGSYEGYGPLVQTIATFFRTREVPIEPAETIELYAFMQAAQASKEKGGQPVSIAQVMQQAAAQAERLLQDAR